MFKDLNLSEGILAALESIGFTAPTEIQEKCIPLIADGRDVVGRSKTGSGKTFAYALPAIDKIDTAADGAQVIVICPTRELALQVTDEIRKITRFKEGLAVVPVYGGSDIKRQIIALKRAKIVVATPGRLMDHIDRRTVRLDSIKFVVLDEADEMLNMGFKEDIERILKHVPKIRQTVMFSATMPPAIKAITVNYMQNPEYVEIGELNATVEEINQTFVRVSRGGKKRALAEIFEKLSPKQAIIFCNTKRMVDEINAFLLNEGINSLALHGDMMQNERKKVMSAVKSHQAAALTATDVAARGIDIDDIDLIINYDLPNDVEYYIHRIGRTGRAGKSGKAISIINTAEQLSVLNRYKTQTKSDINEDGISKSLSVFEDIKEDKTPLGLKSGGRSVNYNQFSKYTGGGLSGKTHNKGSSKGGSSFFGSFEGNTRKSAPQKTEDKIISEKTFDGNVAAGQNPSPVNAVSGVIKGGSEARGGQNRPYNKNRNQKYGDNRRDNANKEYGGKTSYGKNKDYSVKKDTGKDNFSHKKDYSAKDSGYKKTYNKSVDKIINDAAAKIPQKREPEANKKQKGGKINLKEFAKKIFTFKKTKKENNN